jgi:predicted secreted protein
MNSVNSLYIHMKELFPNLDKINVTDKDMTFEWQELIVAAS